MKKNKINEKTIRLIRFCKNNNLYYYIFSKYKSIDYLDTILYRCNAENCFMQMIHYVPIKFNTKYNPIISEKVNITFLNNEWKKFVNDLIESEKKQNELNENIIKTLQKLNYNYSLYLSQYYGESYFKTDYDSSNYDMLFNYFNTIRNI